MIPLHYDIEKKWIFRTNSKLRIIYRDVDLDRCLAITINERLKEIAIEH